MTGRMSRTPAEIAERIADLCASAPPLTDEQRDVLGAALTLPPLVAPLDDLDDER